MTTSFATLKSQVRLHKPKMLLKLWAVLSPRGKRVVDGLGGRQLGARVPEKIVTGSPQTTELSRRKESGFICPGYPY